MSDGKKGCGCGGCLGIIALAIAAWFAWGKLESIQDDIREDREERREETRRNRVDLESAAWAKENATELQRSIEELQLLELDALTRVKALESTLEKLGRDPERDPDLARARAGVAALRDDIEALEKLRAEAWLDFKKFQANPSAGDEERYRQAVRDGLEAGRLARERARRLLDESRDGR